jgi:hypothetical protein
MKTRPAKGGNRKRKNLSKDPKKKKKINKQPTNNPTTIALPPGGGGGAGLYRVRGTIAGHPARTFNGLHLVPLQLEKEIERR